MKYEINDPRLPSTNITDKEIIRLRLKLGDVFEISTDPNELGKVRDALEAKGYSFLSAEVAYVPSTLTTLTDEEAITKMEKLIDMLEENDDVQNIWHNWDAPEEPDED